MTKKELEQQAKEFNVSVEQIKEWRKHIKPFLRFAINELSKDHKALDEHFGLCTYASDYCVNIKELKYDASIYLRWRLKAVRPKNSGADADSYWWGIDSTYTKEGLNKRIDFCKQQLKIVKP